MPLNLNLLTQSTVAFLLVLGVPLTITAKVLGAEGRLENRDIRVSIKETQRADDPIQYSVQPGHNDWKLQPFQVLQSSLIQADDSAAIAENLSDKQFDASALAFIGPAFKKKTEPKHRIDQASGIAKANRDLEQKSTAPLPSESIFQANFSLNNDQQRFNFPSPASSQTSSRSTGAFGLKPAQYAQNAPSTSDVNALLGEGDRQLNEQKYDDAKSIFTTAAQKAEATDNQLGIAQALSGKAAAALGAGQYAEGQETSTQALAALRKVGKKYPTEVEADILLRQGYAYLGQEKRSDLEVLVKQVTPLIAGLKPSERAAGLFVSLADLQYALGKKDLGNESAQKAATFLQKNPDPSGAIAVLSRLAVSQYASEKPDETVKTLDRITDLIDKLSDQSKQVELRQAIGGLYLKLGETEDLKLRKSDKSRQLFEKARLTFEKAWFISAQNNKPEENVKVLLGFGKAYLGLSRNEEAIERAQQALEKIKALEKAAGIEEAPKKSRPWWEKIGCGVEKLVDRSSSCDSEDAELALLNQADTVFKRMKRDARNIIAAARLDQGQYAESDISLREALQITREIDEKLSGVSKTIRQFQGISGIIAILPLGFVSEVGSYINTTAAALDQMIALPQGGFSLLDKINSDMVNNSQKRSLEDLNKQRDESRLRKDTSTEAETLLQIGSVYLGIGKYNEAGRNFKDAASLFKQLQQAGQAVQDGKKAWTLKEAEALLGSARILYLERNYAEAQVVTQQAEGVFQQEGDSSGLANTWLTLGNIYLAQSKFSKAREQLQSALAKFSEKDNNKNSLAEDIKEAQIGKANTLLALGTVALRQRKYEVALKNTEEAIGIFQILRNELESARARLVRGSAYQSLGNHKLALEDAQKALFIFKDLGDRMGEISALNNIGDALQSQRRYEQAIKFYGLSADLQKDLQKYIQKPKSKTGWLVNVFRVGSFFLPWVSVLGQTGFKIYNALSIAQSVVYLSESATSNLGSGFSYLNQGDYDQAMDAFDQVRKASEKQDPQKEAEALLGLSNTRLSFNKEYDMARKDAERAISLFNGIGDRAGAAYALLVQGISYNRLGKAQNELQKQTEYYSKASNAFQQAISTFQDLDLGGEAQAYSALADLFASQKQEGAAITFYKKSIQLTERIRQEIPDGLLRTAYIGNIADTYRRLVELLLSQARFPEAQRVLELLKLQEIDVGVRAKIKPDGKLEYSKIEQQIIDAYKSFTLLGQQVATCEPNCGLDLKNQLNALNKQYEDQLTLLKEELKQRSNSDDLVFKPDALSSKAKRIVNPCQWLEKQGGKCTSAERALQTMLVYPFVGEDKNDSSKYKLWLLWASPQGVSATIERSIDREEFKKSVFEFYDLLSKRENLEKRKELEIVSAQLYDWLVKPLENEMEKGKINNLVFALDRFIRYIPMAALFDKQSGKYLIQKGYKISTIISAEATNIGDRLSSTKEAKVLAMGLTKPKPNFKALTNVRDEIQAIVREGTKGSTGAYPGLPLYDTDFTLENLQTKLSKYRILHLATHGEFILGDSEASYLVLGTGDEKTLEKLTIQLVDEKLSSELTNIHLVVLSACQTGLGGSISQINEREKAEGIEISGLSYSFMRGDRAKAVMASLWSVNDLSTARLMQSFYANLADRKEPMTKAEALRRAQLLLLDGKATQSKNGDDRFIITPKPGSGSASITTDFSHPYFWAPFVLIGNGL